MDHPLPKILDHGLLKKPHLRPPPPPTQQPISPSSNHHHQQFVYRECLKNHAASLGCHALDGCGEFMPSPNSKPSNPTSLTCAACGCHRNFHRRHQGGLVPHHHRNNDEHQDEDDEEGEDYSSPNQYYSPPHMLLALSGRISGGVTGPAAADTMAATGGMASGSSTVMPKKRFRSRFNPEQKERMLELSERLGWKMQKRDGGLVEECCKEIGVGRGVFKVWMHNNKHTFFGPSSSKRGEAAASSGGGGGGGNEESGDGKNGIGNSSQVVNGSASSSSS